MLLWMIHDVNPLVINHWFQFGFTKKFKAVSTKYCCTLCNRSFFCFHNLCRWICKLVNLHMYLFFRSSFQVRSNIWCFFDWSSFQARSNVWCRSFEKTRFRSFHRYVDKWGMKFENLQMFNSTYLFIVGECSSIRKTSWWIMYADLVSIYGFWISSIFVKQLQIVTFYTTTLKKKVLNKYVYWNILCLIWYNFLRHSLMILGIMLLLQVVLFRLRNNDPKSWLCNSWITVCL